MIDGRSCTAVTACNMYAKIELRSYAPAEARATSPSVAVSRLVQPIDNIVLILLEIQAALPNQWDSVPISAGAHCSGAAPDAVQVGDLLRLLGGAWWSSAGRSVGEYGGDLYA